MRGLPTVVLFSRAGLILPQIKGQRTNGSDSQVSGGTEERSRPNSYSPCRLARVSRKWKHPGATNWVDGSLPRQMSSPAEHHSVAIPRLSQICSSSSLLRLTVGKYAEQSAPAKSAAEKKASHPATGVGECRYLHKVAKVRKRERDGSAKSMKLRPEEI